MSLCTVTVCDMVLELAYLLVHFLLHLFHLLFYRQLAFFQTQQIFLGLSTDICIQLESWVGHVGGVGWPLY